MCGGIITNGPLLLCKFTTSSNNLLDLLQIFSGESESKASHFWRILVFRRVHNVASYTQSHGILQERYACC